MGDVNMPEMYSTTDFYTVCMLIARDHPVENIESDGGNSKIKRFFFKDTDELQQDVMNHYNGKLCLSTRDFANAIDNVKRIIRN